jgi:hypothetical protein
MAKISACAAYAGAKIVMSEESQESLSSEGRIHRIDGCITYTTLRLLAVRLERLAD